MGFEESFTVTANMTETVESARQAEKAVAQLKSEVYELGKAHETIQYTVLTAAEAYQRAMDKEVAALVSATQKKNEAHRLEQAELKNMARMWAEIGNVSKAASGTGAMTQQIHAGAAGVAVAVKGGSSAMNTIGMQQLAFAVNDFVSTSGGFAQKLTGIANNMQMVALSMGLGGAWFLAITGAISAIQIFANNYEKIAANIQGLPDPAELKKAADALQLKADAYKASVDAMVARPEPGTEGGQAKAKATVDSVFAGRQAEQIRGGALASALGFGGDFTGAEVAELGEAERGAQRLGGMRETEQALMKGGAPGVVPTISKEMVEAANAKVEEIKQRVAERTANRLMKEATLPGKAGAKARKQLAFMAKQNPGLFPGDLAAKLADIDSADNRAATEAMAAFGAEQDFEDLDMQLGFHGAPPPMRGFGTPQPQFKLPGNIPPGALQNKFGGMDPAEFRKRERERQAQNPHPNVMGPQGNPVHDPRFDELGNVLERTQNAVSTNQQYQSRAAARLARLREKAAELEAANQALQNAERANSSTLLNRGR